MFKKILFAGLLILALNKMGYRIDSLWGGVDAIKNKGKPVSRHTPYRVDFSELENSELIEYADRDSFTIVTFDSLTCSICRELEKGYTKLQKARDDVKIVRIMLPDQMSASSQQEIETSLLNMKKNMDKFKVCGTPHVTVFDPKKKVVAGDNCMDGVGSKYLIKWIKAEGIDISL